MTLRWLWDQTELLRAINKDSLGLGKGSSVGQRSCHPWGDSWGHCPAGLLLPVMSLHSSSPVPSVPTQTWGAMTPIPVCSLRHGTGMETLFHKKQ